MDDRIISLIEQLSTKLGTTTEHLWAVMVQQAAISAAVDLCIFLFLIVVAIIAAKHIKAKTYIPDPTIDNPVTYAQWDSDTSITCITLFWIYCIIVVVLGVSSFPNISTALLNPEYWALKQIL